jgi:hypothetical protein
MTENTFCCSNCKYSTRLNGNLQKHFKSKKHLKSVNTTDTSVATFECNKCDKKYKAKSGLWKHNKICKIVELNGESKTTIVAQEMNMNQELLGAMNIMSEQIKQSNEQMNSRMDKLSSDLKENQQIVQTINNNNNTTINNTFNMSIFLNEKCGNAINFEEFIKKILFEHADSKLMISSYVEGTCNIIQRNLEELPLNKRPLHYLAGEDPHQQLMHIRQDDKWNMSSELNWMQQIHADDDDDVVDKNPIYYALKMIDDEKLKYLGYFFNQDKSYMLEHGRLHREISRPDFKEKVYRKILKMISLDTDKLEEIDVKSKINIE